MNDPNPRNPKPPARLHTINIIFATVASLISIVGGIYSLKANLFQGAPTYGELTGVVRDEKLARPLRLATVEVLDANDEVISTLSTDENGSYLVKNLKDGKYQVKTKAVFHASQTKNVAVGKNATSTIDFNLMPLESEGLKPAVVTRSVLVTPAIPTATYEPPPPTRYNPPVEPPPPVPYSNTNAMLYPPATLRYNPRYPNTATNPSITQGQPSRGANVWVQTGTALLEQWLTERRKKQSTTTETNAPPPTTDRTN